MIDSGSGSKARIWTVGHSSRTWTAFLALIRAHDIEAIVDVRRFPGSRRYPWFARDMMSGQLSSDGVDYLWLEALGGRRKAQPGSPNGAWRNAAFQGYADHMTSTVFQAGLSQVIDLGTRKHTAVMCAEALWWQCHRRLIADLLSYRGHEVLHIMDEKTAQPHSIEPSAQAAGKNLVYPPVQAGLFSS